jgi:hypothetical protein
MKKILAIAALALLAIPSLASAQLRNYQQQISTGVLYQTRANGGGTEQLQPSIEVIGGAVTIYGAQTLPASPPTAMEATAIGFTGIDAFSVVPNYLYLTGTPTSVVLSGIQAVAQ